MFEKFESGKGGLPQLGKPPIFPDSNFSNIIIGNSSPGLIDKSIRSIRMSPEGHSGHILIGRIDLSIDPTELLPIMMFEKFESGKVEGLP